MLVGAVARHSGLLWKGSFLFVAFGSANDSCLLQTLEEEIQHAEAESGAMGDPALGASPPSARIPLDMDDLRRQLAVWEKPLEDAK